MCIDVNKNYTTVIIKLIPKNDLPSYRKKILITSIHKGKEEYAEILYIFQYTC